MNSGMISKRYAKALFYFAQDKNVLDQVFSEMKVIADMLTKNKKIKNMIESPAIFTKNDKITVIGDILQNKGSDVLNRFIQLVIDHRRENHLLTMCLVFIDLYRDYKNIKVGKLITAAPVSSTVTDRIKLLLQAKHKGYIEFENQIDPSIDGGFVLYIDTYRLDASVATQLKNIKRQLLSKNKKVV